MALSNLTLPDFLVRDNGDVSLRSQRVGLYDLLSRYREGYSAEMLALEYPTVPLALIHRTIAFYLENRTDVDDYLNEFAADLDRLESENAARTSLQVLRQRIAAEASAKPTASGLAE